MQTLNSMAITAEDVVLGLEASRAAPRLVALRLEFSYSVDKELTQRPLEKIETIALFFPPGQEDKDIDRRLVEALTEEGVVFATGAMGKRWRGLDVARRPVSALHGVMKTTSLIFDALPSQEEAWIRIAEVARKAGQAASEASGSIGWRRVEDISEATSVMDGLRIAFEDLTGLHEALALRQEIEKHVEPVAPQGPRVSL